jgi:hypothetical protein
LEFLRQEMASRLEHPWHEPDVPETWLFLDEFHRLPPIPELVDFFTLTRSKGATQVVGIQEVDTLVENYGEELSNTILGLLGYVGILKLKNPSSTGYFEKRIGSYEEMVRLKQRGSSVTDNYSPQGVGYSLGQSDGEGEQLMTRPGVLAQELPLPTGSVLCRKWKLPYHRPTQGIQELLPYIGFGH